MYVDLRQHGCADALAAYGCEKTAAGIPWQSIRPVISNAWKGLKPDVKSWPGRASSTVRSWPGRIAADAPSWPGKFRRMMVGEPINFYNQLRDDKLFDEGGLLRRAFDPGNLNTWGGRAQAALMYGLPAYGMYQAAQAPRDVRGSTVGEMLGSTLGGFAGVPLGIVGQMGLATLGGHLGRSVGSVADDPLHIPPPP